MKKQARARNLLLLLSGRDTGELPAVMHPDRKVQAAASFRLFCETYFPRTIHLAWSPDRRKVIAKIEEAVLPGGLQSKLLSGRPGSRKDDHLHAGGQN